MVRTVPIARTLVCKDCRVLLPEQLQQRLADERKKGIPANIKGLRPAPFPGPRCHTHHLAFLKRRKDGAHRARKDAQFGLGEGGYDRLLAAQGGACGGCGTVPGPAARRMAVDHDHRCCSGKTSCGKCVRGLLCFKCNDTLARYRDNADALHHLADYLTNWPSRRLR